MKNGIILVEKNNKLIVKERTGKTITTLMEITAGAVTAVQMELYKAKIEGRIKQAEADLILKYFYGLYIK